MYAHLSPYTQVEIKSIAKMEVPGMYALQVSQRNQGETPMTLSRHQVFSLAGNLINHSRLRMNYVAKNGDIDGIVTAITKNTDKLPNLRIHYKDGDEEFYEYESFDEFVDNIISYVGDGHGTIKFMNQ
jgi:hypothetical protein